MKFVRIAAFALAALAALPSFSSDGPKWSDWSDDLFARAQAEQRFVILDLEAVWCHWCHVMEKTTYANPEVRKLLAAKYLPVRVDQDANPDLSSPLWRLGLAGDHRVRPRRHRDRQDQGLYRAGAHAGAAQGDHRRSLARTVSRRSL
ncbi:DUF255 domain-containing protein [Bradyrhizobium murdochi]|uniref:DUF255 domain-containing protein n=1 Tax=Bradyrhizobium murdochi TaxID=1038859 RepID=UPI000A067AE4|nr:DUF255 domain-containing protein [Bradyrhizobium murdochi]